MQVIIDRIAVNYEIVGDLTKSAILILHGWGENSKNFSDLANMLSKEKSVILVDLPGFGKTEAPEKTWGLNDYANFVHEFLQKISMRPSDIIGHSNGGAIAIRGLSEQKLTADKLILLSSSGIRSDYKGRKKALRIAAKSAKVFTGVLPKHTQLRIKKKAYGVIGSDLFVAEGMQETFKKVVTDDVLADARKISVSTLLIYGSDDTATPPEYGERFQSVIQGAQLEIVNGAGHFVHVDEPEKTVNLIKKFLQ